MTSVRDHRPMADRPCVDYLGQSAGFPLHRPSLSRQAAFWLVAYVLGVTNLGTTVPAPLYKRCRRHAGRQRVAVRRGGAALAQVVGAVGPAFYGALIGNGHSRTGLAMGYLAGGGIMILGGLVEVFLGIDAEGKPLEEIAAPLTETGTGSDSDVR